MEGLSVWISHDYRWYIMVTISGVQPWLAMLVARTAQHGWVVTMVAHQFQVPQFNHPRRLQKCCEGGCGYVYHRISLSHCKQRPTLTTSHLCIGSISVQRWHPVQQNRRLIFSHKWLSKSIHCCNGTSARYGHKWNCFATPEVLCSHLIKPRASMEAWHPHNKSCCQDMSFLGIGVYKVFGNTNLEGEKTPSWPDKNIGKCILKRMMRKDQTPHKIDSICYMQSNLDSGENQKEHCWLCLKDQIPHRHWNHREIKTVANYWFCKGSKPTRH